MAEPNQYLFAYPEIAEALVKQQGIHEGYWGVYVEFGLNGANINTNPDGSGLVPAAIIPLSRMGLQRYEQPNELTVDAAKVNPQAP